MRRVCHENNCYPRIPFVHCTSSSNFVKDFMVHYKFYQLYLHFFKMTNIDKFYFVFSLSIDNAFPTNEFIPAKMLN